MAETRRRVSLLDFAIAASFAIVPILAVVLIALDRIAPSARAGRDGDRHASVRQVAALRTFEHAIVRRDLARASIARPEAILDALPECRDEWTGRGRWLDRVRVAIGLEPDATRLPVHRLAASLEALDQALARLDTGGNRRVDDPVAFDVARWGKAARDALATPVESERYPGRRFAVRCADLAAAAHALARSQGRMLSALAWRGSEVERTVAAWRPDQVVAIGAHHVARSNPWTGARGCVYLWQATADGADRPAFFVASRQADARWCDRADIATASVDAIPFAAPVALRGEPSPTTPPGDPRWQVPPSLDAMLRALEPLQRPVRNADLARRVSLDGGAIDIGDAVDLAIDPALQSLAQQTAACYTGRHDVCDALGMRRAEDGGRPLGHRHLEGALVRMAAVAIVDVASGRIEALAGALSPCTRQEYDGPGRDASCDKRLPYPVRYRPDALLNPAVFHDAMPASIVKPVLASAFLSNASVGERWLAAERPAMRSDAAPARNSLRGQLMRSDSARFLDRMFCADRAFVGCERVWEVQAVAAALGWNGGCAEASERCGRRDLLFGRAFDANAGDVPASWVPYGRILVEPAPAATFRLRAPIALDIRRVARCAAGADGRRESRDDWEKCKGGAIVDIVAEGWGQGHARASALGAAGMIAALAARANGQADIPAPHLVRSIRSPGQRSPRHRAPVAGANVPLQVTREAAEVVFGGLAWSHRLGTARRACEQVFDARSCRDIAWIAGKTGTPTFRNDDRSLDELSALCAGGVSRMRSENEACGSLRPYKWYVAAYRTGAPDAGWTKAIAVLTERNWIAASGRVHGAGDHGPNPAAEIAFQVAGRHVGAIGAEPR